MLSEKITVVYSTSPHRFGDSTAMIDLSIATLKSFGFEGCKFIICADGVNESSRFKTKEEKDKYKKYLSNLKSKHKDVEVLCSKKNIGLTNNYKQVWDHKKINTDFVFFMNHDVAVTPELKNIDLDKLITDWPKEAKTLVFARRDNSFWKRWFDPSEYKSSSYWKNTLKSFGFQDNSCIMKKEAYKEYIDAYYNPSVTKFLEDSIQCELKKIRSTKSLQKWKPFGVFVWKDPCSFHLDGQSKADNGKHSESVWSNGLCASKTLKSIKDSNAGNKTNKAVDKFIYEEVKYQSEKVYNNFYGFASSLINMSNLHIISDEPIQSKKANNRKLNLPRQTDRLEKISLNKDSITINWIEGDDENIVSRVVYDGKQIAYGGNSKGFCEVPLSGSPDIDLDIRIVLKKFSSKGKFQEDILDQTLNLSAIQVRADDIDIKWDQSVWKKLTTCGSFIDPKIHHSGSVEEKPFKLGLQCGDSLFVQLSNGSENSWEIEAKIPCDNFYDARSKNKIKNLILAADSGLSELLKNDERKSIEHFMRYWENH